MIRDDLFEQLESQGKHGKFFEDLVDDYIYFYKLKKKLKEDIKKNGLRVKMRNGNGIECEKPNESIQNLLKTNTQMLKILQDLELKTPVVLDDDPEDYM